MTRAPIEVAKHLDELVACAVCRVIGSHGSQLVIDISDSFWPNQKQQATEPEFV
jgi:hypothetical protein